MMPQVVAKSLDLLIVLPKIFIVFPNQFPTLKEKPLLGAALGFPPEQVNEGGQDAGSEEVLLTEIRDLLKEQK